jgi:hypothetical protein
MLFSCAVNIMQGEQPLATDSEHKNRDDEPRLRYRPGQPVEKDAAGHDVAPSPGPDSPTAGPVSVGGSAEQVDPALKGPNPVAEGTEEGDYGKSGPPGPETEADRGPRGTPATS